MHNQLLKGCRIEMESPVKGCVMAGAGLAMNSRNSC
jgi:hypothetical protein